MQVEKEDLFEWPSPTIATVTQIAEKFNAGYDRKV